MKYTITLDEQQLRLIMRGLEAISRSGTKQYDYALEQLDPTLFERVGGLNEMWNIRDFIRDIEGSKLCRHESLGIGNASEDARMSYDMYQAMLDSLGKGRGFYKTSKADKITIKEDDDEQ